jgi:ABC-type nitrate/sulfonate/bicarbonate transport system permease component
MMTSSILGSATGSILLMNEASRKNDATLVKTTIAGMTGVVGGFALGFAFAFGWPIAIAAGGFNALNKQVKMVTNASE